GLNRFLESWHLNAHRVRAGWEIRDHVFTGFIGLCWPHDSRFDIRHLNLAVSNHSPAGISQDSEDRTLRRLTENRLNANDQNDAKQLSDSRAAFHIQCSVCVDDFGRFLQGKMVAPWPMTNEL